MGLTLRLHGFTSLGHSSSFLVVRGTVDVFTVCHDVVCIGQVLVVGTCVLMQHCETIHSFLRFLHPLCGLEEEFDPADVDGGYIKLLSIATALFAEHFCLVFSWWLWVQHVTGC